jgi:hypothetical protein
MFAKGKSGTRAARLREWLRDPWHEQADAHTKSIPVNTATGFMLVEQF